LSSILDALNKLEKEESQQDYHLTRARTDGKVFTSKITLGIIGVVCVCVVAIGFGAYYRRNSEKAFEPMIETARPAVTSGAKKMLQPGAGAIEQKRPLASPIKTPVSLPPIPPEPKTMATATASQAETLSLENRIKKKPTLSKDENNIDEIETEQIQGVVSAEDPMEEAVADAARQDSKPPVVSNEEALPDSMEDGSKEALVQEEKPLPMDRLEGVSFKIQAISWGEAPQERLVVISNQVLREGDGIEGYRISRINPDDIVLRRGDDAYRLDFGLKGGP
jgi:hypothetical protein